MTPTNDQNDCSHDPAIVQKHSISIHKAHKFQTRKSTNKHSTSTNHTMKIYNIALTTLALMLSPSPILAKETAVADTVQQVPTFQGQPHQGQVTNRYIVKFKAGSTEFKTRMQQAARQSSGANLRKSAAAAGSNENHLAFGNFLPKENAEVLYLDSEEDVKAWNNKGDVEYVELGKLSGRTMVWHCDHFLSIFPFIFHSFLLISFLVQHRYQGIPSSRADPVWHHKSACT